MTSDEKRQRQVITELKAQIKEIKYQIQEYYSRIPSTLPISGLRVADIKDHNLLIMQSDSYRIKSKIIQLADKVSKLKELVGRIENGEDPMLVLLTQ
jgi:hypothetical protein